MVTAAAGCIAGAFGGHGEGRRRSRPFQGAFTGALRRPLRRPVGFAVIQSLEWPLGTWSSSPPAAIGFWAALGLAVAAVSWLLLPTPGTTPTTPPRAEPAP